MYNVIKFDTVYFGSLFTETNNNKKGGGGLYKQLLGHGLRNANKPLQKKLQDAKRKQSF